MATQAKRLARGTDHAISRILSSLSAPSVASAAKIEAPEEHPLSTAGGPESEASMAAAVADMAIRLNQTPPEEPSEIPPPVIEVAEITPMATIAETSQAELATEAAPTETVVEATPEPAAETEPTPPLRAPVEHFKRSAETFGRTRSFAIAGRTHHRPSPEARPVSSLGKITASGLIVPGRSGAAQQELETPPPAPEPIVSSPPQPEDLKTATVKPMPAPTSPDAYKPWV
jgi:hypothetical protein